jgi:hypothetical protein
MSSCIRQKHVEIARTLFWFETVSQANPFPSQVKQANRYIVLPTRLTCINDTCHIERVFITQDFRQHCIKDCILGKEYFGIVYNPDEPLSIPLVTSTFTVPADVNTADGYDVEMALEDLEDLQSQLSS